jgi:hypothetical protein
VQVREVGEAGFARLPWPAAADVVASVVIALHRYSTLGENGILHFLFLVSLPASLLIVRAMGGTALAQVLPVPGGKPFIHALVVFLGPGGMLFLIHRAMLAFFALSAVLCSARACYCRVAHRPAVEGTPHSRETGESSASTPRVHSAADVHFPGPQGER